MKQLEHIPEYHVGHGVRCDDPEPKAFDLGNDRVVVVLWTVDEHGYEYLGDLGKYTSQREEFVIDRETGVMMGDGEEEPELDNFLPAQYKQDVKPFVHDYDIPDDVWEDANAKRDKAYDQWNDLYGYGEVAADLSTWGGRNEYQFFKAAQDYLSHEWGYSDKEVLEFYAKRYKEMTNYWIPQLAGVEGNPTPEQAKRCLSILYIALDYERAEGLLPRRLVHASVPGILV